MKTDTRGHRHRHVRPKTPKAITIYPRDIAWLHFLHLHGGRLPTSYLHDHTKDTHVSMWATLERLRRLYDAHLIDRPFQQFETIDPRWNELVHEVSPKGLELLKERGLLSPYVPSPHGFFKHQLMLSCISASFDLNSRSSAYKYIPQSAFLEPILHDSTIKLDGKDVKPDLVFLLIKDGKQLLVFLEVDRGTEANRSGDDTRKSAQRSVRQYQRIIGEQLYKEAYNVDCPALLMIVTISERIEDNILKVVSEEFDGACNYILTTSLPEFGREFHPPKLIDMLGTKWNRCGYKPFML